MRRKIKTYVLNMHVVSAFSVLAICVSLISCDYWFGKEDGYDVQMGIYAGDADSQQELATAPLAPDRKLLFTSSPAGLQVVEKSLVAYEFGSRPFKASDRRLDP